MDTTASQLRAIAIVPMVSGSISFISSIILIYIILRSHLKLSTVYHRITFVLSCCDLFQSISHALSCVPAPKGTPGALYALGNQLSCDIQGFFYVFGSLSLMFYFCGLTGYFNLAIKLEISEERIQKYFEPAVHAISLVYALFGAIYVLASDGYYTTGNICWIAPRPFRCEYNEDVDCSSGSAHKFEVMRWIFIAGPVFLSFLFIVINMLMIFCALWAQNRSINLSISSRADEINNIVREETPRLLEGTTLDTQERNNLQTQNSRIVESYAATKKDRKLSNAEIDRKEAMIQALLYIFVFFFCYFAILTFRFMEYYGTPISLNLYIISRGTSPLQGFGVFVIFIRPRFMNMKKRQPSYSWIQVLVGAIQSKGIKVKRRRRKSMVGRLEG